MLKPIISALVLLAALASCSGSGRGSSDSVDTLDLKGEIIIPYDSLQQPMAIYATDSKLYLVNMTSVDTIVEEFSHDGQFIRSFLRRGNGPNEVAYIYALSLDSYRKQLDIVKSTNSLEVLNLEGSPSLSQVFSYKVPDDTDYSSPNASVPLPVGAMIRLADGSIVAGNMSRGGLLAIFGSDGTFRQFAADYPSKSEFGEGIPEYMLFNLMRPGLSVSPDGRHFAASMGVADYLVFGELDGDSVKVTGSCVAPPKGIKIEVGNGWSNFEYEDSYTVPLKTHPVMSADKAYVVRNDIPEKEYLVLVKKMSEGEIPAEGVITEYDFNGNIVGAIHIDALPRVIAVTPDGSTFFVLTETADDGIFVKRYNR